MNTYSVYLLTNKNNTVIYAGVTNDLARRIWEHKFGTGSKFTKKYNCNKLVYFENFHVISHAIEREKQIKAGSRQKKEDLINLENPTWNDLSERWFD